MTIAEVLQKAVEGGYHINGSDGMDTDSAGASRACSAWTRTDTASTCLGTVEETFLDPHFWRALGLTLGWHTGVATKCLDIEKRVPRYPRSVSQEQPVINIKIQLPSFPFGCYINPSTAALTGISSVRISGAK